MTVLTLSSLVDIRDNYVSYGGNKYFRRGAERIELCSHGRKQTPMIGANYMSVSAKIARHHLEDVAINVGDPIEVNWSEVTQDELDQWGSLSFFGINAEAAEGFDLRTAQRQNLKLMCIWINETPLINCLNRDANAVRNDMADEGKDARIVSSILVATDTLLANHFASHSSSPLTVSAFDSELGITAGTGRLGSKTIRLAEGTTFAYGLHKVRRWSKRKEQIEELADDWFAYS